MLAIARLVVVLVVSALAALSSLAAGTTLAAGSLDSYRQQKLSDIKGRSAKLERLREQIDASDGSRIDLIEEYLDNALMNIYQAKTSVNDEMRGLGPTNQDLTRLVEIGYLPAWPLNPLNNWEPMRVLSVDDPFLAGDIVFELCPADRASRMQDGGTERASFNVYVYGLEGKSYAAIDFGRYGDWATPPAGALNGFIYYQSSAAEDAERKQRQLERGKAEKAAAEAAEAAATGS